MRLLIIVFTLLISASTASACSCVNWFGMSLKDMEQYHKLIPAIFEGEVISLGEKRTILRKICKNQYYNEIVQPVRFKVFRIWKGIDNPEVTVDTDVSSSCHFVPTIGTKYTVYAGRSRGEGLTMNMCSVDRFNNELLQKKNNELLKKKYGNGKVIEHKSIPQTPNLPETPIISMIWTRIVNFFI